jgi:aspartate/methionine/tyrosine aminotransferase
MTIHLRDLPKSVIEMAYAVRGPIVERAMELEGQGREIIYCNIGNPQSFGQKPITYVRQLLALCEYPDLMRTASHLFPGDVIETAEGILTGTKHGLGAYSESRGVRFIREAVANFIQERDGVGVDPDCVYLTDGASSAVESVLRLLVAGPNDGVMLPIPQYPLYSATLTLLQGKAVPYYLDEQQGWRLNLDELEKALERASERGIRTKGICVINPGNPTGAVLDKGNIGMILEFASRHGLSVLADEVYQEEIYLPGVSFVSFARVLHEEGIEDVSLFSAHSCSKGFLGECGVRGGYFEYRNVPPDVAAEVLKLQSVSLCANLPGQVATYAMVCPPKPGSESYERYEAEKNEILDEMKHRAWMVADGLNRIAGVSCNPIAGAIYAFPSITLPAGKTDEAYCLALLEDTGICVVPGSGFGQLEGTTHFRTTILPPRDQIRRLVERVAAFHARYTSTYATKST